MESERNGTSMDKNPYSEQTVYGGGYFPDELPSRPAPSPAAARWTKLRGFFTFSPRSYNFIHTPDGQARVRRIAMLVILGLRSAMSALSIVSAVINGSLAGIIIYSLLAVLSLWFTATCLAIIGNAAGDRNYSGKVIKRWHFDVFLGFCVVVHAGLIIAWCFGLTGWALEVAGIGMWFAILGVAFLAGWQPKSYSLVWVT
ncbi:uncharacterized protein PV07_09035 [Cladophialophora immunda]|uniref:Uncharacterized protein n=1 Tax=Cladophialophora immunda TaxID=569365 RepID=A0A0D2CQN2_9EURO|nr:uncharacterized protein PV07_09035 [Cladophialophora immunda]KIW25899.1 hypothetical protein PV07_09035 [Cladophialophora immunda]OQV08969.1 hypothetical protein CLAIMM_13163 [Cladophialophora immunda]